MPEEPGFLIIRVMTNAAIMAYLVAAGRLFFEPASPSVLLSAFAMAVSAVIFAWVQRNVKGIFVYSLIHMALVAVLAVTAAGLFDTIFRMVVIVYATFMAFHARIRKSYLVYPAPSLLAIPGVVFVPAYTLGNRPVQTISVLMVTFLMLAWLFYRNLSTFAGTIREARAFTKVPFHRMRRVNAGILAVFITASAALAAMTALIVDGEAVLITLRDGIETLMRLVIYGFFWLISLFLRGGEGERTEEAVEQAQQGMSLGGEAASHPILEMIYKILEVVIIIAVTIAICYIVYRLIVNFYHDFRAADMENKDKRRYILPEERAMVNEYLGVMTDDPAEAVDKMVRAALASVADTCIIPLQDYLGLDNSARINKPSTNGGNWQWRAKEDVFTKELAARIRRLTVLYGRE